MDLENMSHWEKTELAKNPSASKDILRELAKDQDDWIRRQVAKNSNTPEDVLNTLTADTEDWVRYHVARNPNISGTTLQKLTHDEDWNVRVQVLNSPKVSIKIIVMLFEQEKNLKKPERNVIRALYNNSKLPYIARVIIETLYGDWL